MSMTVEDRWQQIDRLLRKHNRAAREEEQLCEEVVGLLEIPEGRESVRKRLAGEGGKFVGRDRFIQGVCLAFQQEGPALSKLAPVDRHQIQLGAVEKTRPGSDQSHWDLLWLLHRDGYAAAESMIIDSLDRVAKNGVDLAHTLAGLPPWRQLSPDRIVTLLEVAAKGTPDPELSGSFRRALSLAKHVQQGKGGPPPIPPYSPDTSPEVEGLGSTPAAPERGVAIPSTNNRLRTPSESAQDVAASVAAPPPGHSPQITLPVALAGIQALFQALEDTMRGVEGERDAVRQELEDARKAIGHLGVELRREQELAQDQERKAVRVEGALAERDREVSEARTQVHRLGQQLREASQEIESTHRRTEDYVHEASLARDNAVRSFQAGLWDRLRGCLIDVLDDDHTDPSTLNADQMFCRRRLEEIRDTLRELGVPPS